MKFIKIFILLNLIYWPNYANVLININIRAGDTLTVKYYKPFKGFANEDLQMVYGTRVSGQFSFSLTISHPTFIKLIFNNAIVELLCEPNDTLQLKVKDVLKSKNDWLEIEGKNRKGIAYYNLIYNRVRSDKFYKIRTVFEDNYHSGGDVLFDRIKNEISRQTNWVDSLLKTKDISPPFADFMNAQISYILAWEVGEECNKYFEANDPLSITSSTIKRRLFEVYNPLDYRLRTCLAMGYYYTYFAELYKGTPISADTLSVIVNDTPFYSLAPLDIQGYLWGASLLAHYLYDPDTQRNCKAFKKYASKFENSPYVTFFNSSDICSPKEKREVNMINPVDMDLFSFIKFNFYGKRVFVDLWATWCAPCKMEFKFYDAAFYEFMKDHKIEVVFISIDDPKRRDQWEREVNTFNLKGNHILAETLLQASLKEVVYDDGNVVIPRYLLADETGKILSTDFMRPSDPQFQNEIRKQFR